MKPKNAIILAFGCFLTIQAVSQDTSKPQTQAQCQFSDGKKITVSYSSELSHYQLVTDGNLVTIKGVPVPAGDYIVVRRLESPNHWDLIMRNAEKGQSSDLPPLPMSVTTFTSPVGNVRISFDQTGGSCMLHWASEKSNMLLSLEFTEKNTDLPVLR
jgi:hypothetical protein